MLMQGITYNTAMALVVGVVMVLAALFARSLSTSDVRNISGWGWAFVATGFFLSATGLHMMLTWPLAQIDGAFCCAVDNISFGEPAALYGVLAFFAGLAMLHAQRRLDAAHSGSLNQDLTEVELHSHRTNVLATLRPLLIVGAIGGFGLILLGIAGMHFGQWRPPEVEPVARLMAGSLIEPLMVMSLYIGTGVSAIVSPFIGENKTIAKIWTIGTVLVGLVWIMLSFTLFYSHIGFFPQPDGSYK